MDAPLFFLDNYSGSLEYSLGQVLKKIPVEGLRMVWVELKRKFYYAALSIVYVAYGVEYRKKNRNSFDISIHIMDCKLWICNMHVAYGSVLGVSIPSDKK